jgi:transglutaminase/protease-like cytokinesis protein 3
VKLFFSAFLLLLFTTGYSQQSASRYAVVDEYVQSLGSLDTLNVGTISYLLTKKFNNNEDKLRAIYYWVANNISFDCKLARISGNEKITSEIVLKKRKTNASGYAALFQDMCSVAKIRCLTVEGFAKNNTGQINEVPDEHNHTWAVVQLGISEDSWYYMDPTWGSGYTDEKMTLFTKAFNEGYFFADKAIFNYQHLPDNTAWLLGPGTKNVKDFFALPVVNNYAHELKLSNFSPATGLIKATTKKAVAFSFKIKSGIVPENISLETGSGKNKKLKTIYFSFNNSVVSFTHKFEEEDSYPISIIVNGKPLLGYLVEITE